MDIETSCEWENAFISKNKKSYDVSICYYVNGNTPSNVAHAI